MILHFSQILFTEGRTFIAFPSAKHFIPNMYVDTQPQVYIFVRRPAHTPPGVPRDELMGRPTCSGT
jgi:hypothetical protein